MALKSRQFNRKSLFYNSLASANPVGISVNIKGKSGHPVEIISDLSGEGRVIDRNPQVGFDCPVEKLASLFASIN